VLPILYVLSRVRVVKIFDHFNSTSNNAVKIYYRERNKTNSISIRQAKYSIRVNLVPIWPWHLASQIKRVVNWSYSTS